LKGRGFQFLACPEQAKRAEGRRELRKINSGFASLSGRSISKKRLEIAMPGRGRSSFTKRQKEHTRQQKQRDKAERRIQRKDEPLGTPGDSNELDLDELQRHAAEQAALFQLGDDADISSIPREREPEKTEP
jgi:hypothetical protein